MIYHGLAEIIGNRRTFTTIQLLQGPDRLRAGKHYSHKEDTKDNPKNVWTLIPANRIDVPSINITVNSSNEREVAKRMVLADEGIRI